MLMIIYLFFKSLRKEELDYMLQEMYETFLSYSYSSSIINDTLEYFHFFCGKKIEGFFFILIRKQGYYFGPWDVEYFGL